MNFDEYQDLTAKTAHYPEGEEIRILTLGVVGESGEIAEKVKKWRREDDDSYLEDLEDEIGDVLWYLSRLSDELDLSFDSVANRNIEKVTDRDERGVIIGEGDDR